MFISKAILRLTHPYEIDPRSIKAQQHQQIDPAVIDTLGLNLDEEATIDTSLYNADIAQTILTKPFTLRHAAKEVIDTINKAIQEKSNANSETSLQEKHLITIYTSRFWIKRGSNLFFYANCCGLPSEPFSYEKEQVNNLWLNRIIKALVDRNHIQVTQQFGESCVIQA